MIVARKRTAAGFGTTPIDATQTTPGAPWSGAARAASGG